jgi:hypothetical protein
MLFVVEYTLSVEVRGRKPVTCQQCGHEYSYVLTREGSGKDGTLFGLAPSRAQDKARDRAEQAAVDKLRRECDPVPCPACGWYQPDMVREARRRKYGWMTRYGGRALALWTVLAFISVAMIIPIQERLPFWFVVGFLSAVVALGGTAVGLLVGRVVLGGQYDPNMAIDEEERKRYGQSRVAEKWVEV